MQNRSVKNYSRMLGLLVMATIFWLIAAFLDPLTLYGVMAQGFSQLFKASIVTFVFYWVLRFALHTRTHEVEIECSKEAMCTRENYLVVGYAIVFAATLIAG